MNEPQTSAPPTIFAPLGLLVVDDEPEVLGAMAEFLGAVYPVIHRAGSAAAALALVRQHADIATVVADIRMPEVDGLSLLRQMMAERGYGPAALTVVMITGHGGLEAARGAMREGAVEFLTKPFTGGELRAAVRHALSMARARRAQAEATTSQAQALALALAAARPGPESETAPAPVAMRPDQLAVLAHGLRTPLVPLVGLAELLQESDLPRDQIKEFARSIAENADQLQHNVNSLLDFDGLTHGAITMRPQPIIASRLAADALRRVAPQAARGKVTLHHAVPDALRLRADADWLAWAVTELLTNAVRVSPAGGIVALAAGPEGAGAWLTVTDQGPGLPDTLLNGGRQPFASAEPVLNRSSTTLGLGLAMVDRIVALHGGTLVLHRLPAGGSEARLLLPG